SIPVFVSSSFVLYKRNHERIVPTKHSTQELIKELESTKKASKDA
ncbi:20085_t:CDS:2, partial [Racocetra persica]